VSDSSELSIVHRPPAADDAPYDAPRADPPRQAPLQGNAPRQRKLGAVSVIALTEALIGLLVGFAALIQIIAGAPGWFEPTIIAVGLAGTALTATAFITIQHRWLPWAMLGGGGVALITAIAIISAA